MLNSSGFFLLTYFATGLPDVHSPVGGAEFHDIATGGQSGHVNACGMSDSLADDSALHVHDGVGGRQGFYICLPVLR